MFNNLPNTKEKKNRYGALTFLSYIFAFIASMMVLIGIASVIAAFVSPTNRNLVPFGVSESEQRSIAVLASILTCSAIVVWAVIISAAGQVFRVLVDIGNNSAQLVELMEEALKPRK